MQVHFSSSFLSVCSCHHSISPFTPHNPPKKKRKRIKVYMALIEALHICIYVLAVHLPPIPAYLVYIPEYNIPPSPHPMSVLVLNFRQKKKRLVPRPSSDYIYVRLAHVLPASCPRPGYLVIKERKSGDTRLPTQRMSKRVMQDGPQKNKTPFRLWPCNE